MSTYFDYRFMFPVTGLSTALQAMSALRSAGLLGAGDIPENMIGNWRDNSGSVAASPTLATWRGDRGVAAFSYTDDAGVAQNVQARGDPANYYIHIRATVDPTTLPFNPATYGLIPSDPTVSAAVLGVWA